MNIYPIFFSLCIFNLLKSSVSNSDFCTEEFSITDVPLGLLTEILTIITAGASSFFFGCLEEDEPPLKSVKLFLYNKKYSLYPLLLTNNNLEEIDGNLPTKILLHGWLCNITNDRIPELKNAYLNRGDYNVIAVDWSDNSIDLYVNSYCVLPKIAEYIAKFVCSLQTLNYVHLIGHSMGGQLAGLIGDRVQKMCNKRIARITGLDPAGPLYYGLPIDRRLDSSDAEFVDVIHTNGGFFGYLDSCGTVDFFPDCGISQRSCFNENSIDDNLPKLVTTHLACSHLRSCDYMIESIKKESYFIGRKCTNCPSLFCNCENSEVTTIMGEDCPINTPNDNYYVSSFPSFI